MENYLRVFSPIVLLWYDRESRKGKNMKTITVFNQKGGVGKTTTVVNLAAGLARHGKQVLVVDMDPQGNATSGFGVSKEREKTIYNLILGEASLDEVRAQSSREGVSVIPASSDVAGLEVELAREGKWQYKLRKALKGAEADFVLIDSPPSLGILSLMSLAASDSILIPVQCEYYALEGVGALLQTIDLVRENFYEDLQVEGVLMTMYDGRTNLGMQVVEEVKNFFENRVYQTLIPRNVRLAEAPSYGEDIFAYEEKSKGAQAYEAFVQEFLERQEG